MKDFSFWKEYEGASEGSGRSEKIWLINPDNNQTGLFKFKKDENTTDHISERISYQIAKLLDIPCAQFDIGTYNGKEGSMSYNIVDKEDMLFLEGIYVINESYPTYDPEKFVVMDTGEAYSVEMLEKVLGPYGVFGEFIGLLTFDYLIGNTDRHQSNWALILENEKWRLSPLYDNSSSLCAYESGEKLKLFMGKDKLLWKSLVDTKSKSCIKLSINDKVRPTHLEVMQYLKDKHLDKVKLYVMKIFQEMTQENICAILNEYAEIELSNEKKKVINNFLVSKVEMLAKLFD